MMNIVLVILLLIDSQHKDALKKFDKPRIDIRKILSA